MRVNNAQASLCLFCTYGSQPWVVGSFRRESTTTGSKNLRGRSLMQYSNLRPKEKKLDQRFVPHGEKIRTPLKDGLSPQARLFVRDNALIRLTIERLKDMSKHAHDPDFMVRNGLMRDTAKASVEDFENKYLRILRNTNKEGGNSDVSNVLDGLRQAYVVNGPEGIDAQLKFLLQGHLANANFSKSDILGQARLADLRYPYEWYPEARKIQRKIHLHVGPTNSGKTYHALKRLESASSGVYAGPLRLLAHEVYSRLNAMGKPCNLVTGDERIFVEAEASSLSACTVEMVPIQVHVEVAVVDEVQMIANQHRGWAWTHAILALKADELHLCGEERVVPIIEELAAAMGDDLEIHRYKRLSPLRMMSTSLGGDLTKLRKGDCLVTFSRMQIHALRKDIERITGKRVAVVYGSLPPEIRAQQAKLFNDPNNDYDILVASDAIGMGLNLSIKRIVFETTSRHDGESQKTLNVPDIKQIAGRAGRYRTTADAQVPAVVKNDSAGSDGITSSQVGAQTPATNLGLVTTLEKADLPIVLHAMQSEAAPLTKIGIQPPDSVILRFSTYFPPETPFSYILLRLYEISRMHPRFQLCNLRNIIGIADIIQPVQGLTTTDRITLCSAPVDQRDLKFSAIVVALAKRIATQSGGALLDIQEIDVDILDAPITADKAYLHELERLYKALVLYLWLSYRFTGIFSSQDMAFHVKTLVEDRVVKVLKEVSERQDTRNILKKHREQAMLQALRTQLEYGESKPSDMSSTDTLGIEDGIVVPLVSDQASGLT